MGLIEIKISPARPDARKDSGRQDKSSITGSRITERHVTLWALAR